jgi:hypothetical protein
MQGMVLTDTRVKEGPQAVLELQGIARAVLVVGGSAPRIGKIGATPGIYVTDCVTTRGENAEPTAENKAEFWVTEEFSMG